MRSFCAWLQRMMSTDPRMRVIDAAARYLFLELARQAASLPEPGALKLGARGVSAREISLMVSMPETEVETHLETLLETQLLIRDAAGVLRIADLPAAASRRGVGGRPRKGETKQAYDARQRELRLLGVHAGGAASAAAENPGAETPETRAETPLARAKLASFSSSSLEAKEAAAAAASPPAWVLLGEKLAAIAGLDPARGAYGFEIVRHWLALPGASAEVIVEAVGRVAARPSYAPPRHLGYFAGAVTEAAHEAASAPAPPAPDPEYDAALAAWRRERDIAMERGGLEHLRPRPERRSVAA